MPTYLCFSAEGRLNRDQKQRIARTITAIHSEEARAPGYFAEVIFQYFRPEDYFQGGEPGPASQIWIHGDIRGGRTPDQRARLLLRICGEVSAIADVPGEDVWVYLNEMEPANMVEYGALLPLPGQEEAWFQALPEGLRGRLASLGKTGA